MDNLERNEKGRTILDYISTKHIKNRTLWDSAIRDKDDPFLRKGTPPKVKTHFGTTLLFNTRGLTKSLDKYTPTPGSLWRFSYNSSFDDNREHDPFPYIILLQKESTGLVFNKSTTVRDDKYPSVLGKKYFYGLNLNYLRMDLAALYIEAVNIQKILGDFVSEDMIKGIDSAIPKHAFRMYYLDWCSGFRRVSVKREEKNGDNKE